MTISSAYTAISPNEKGDIGDTYFFMMNSLLYSRMESGHPSNDEFYDEDVNVYVAGLLASLIDPAAHEALKRYVVTHDLPLFEAVSAMPDSGAKCRAYKANGDFILLSIGLFNNPSQSRPHAPTMMSVPVETYIGRGMAYYRLAESYCFETYRRATALGTVLGKLSVGFEKYLEVLSLMRSEYLNLYRQISSGELFHLEHSVDRLGRSDELGALYDEFLDALSAHRRERSPQSKRSVDALGRRIGALDPTFRYECE